MSYSQTIAFALTKVENGGTDTRAEHAGTDQKVEHAGTDQKIEHAGTDTRSSLSRLACTVLTLAFFTLPGTLLAGELEGFFPYNDGVWKVRGALSGPLTMQYVGNDTVNVSFATYDEKGMPMMLVGSGSWSDGLIELPLYQVKAISGFTDFAPMSNLVPWGHAALLASDCGSMDGELWQFVKTANGGTGQKTANGGTGTKTANGGTGNKTANGGTGTKTANAGTGTKTANAGTGNKLISAGLVKLSSGQNAGCALN